MTEIITINTKGIVPNHLNDTNIFYRYSNNTIIEVDPKEIHFAGYKLNERNFQEIKFTNISNEISRFHIIPPVSKYFRLKYQKPECMVPGSSVKCTVIFTPDKARNYNDFIKIHTKDSINNLIVPVYAYPAIAGLQVPRNLMFPTTSLGKKCLKKLTLHSDSDTDFEFEIIVVKDHPSISINPLTGVIPAKGDALIALQFHPTDYTTCEKTINIYVSQYNFKPIICTISGKSDPGMQREQIIEQIEKSINDDSDLISISKLETKRKIAKSEYNVELNTERKDIISQKSIKRITQKNQLKADFENRVRTNVMNEKQNQLRWQVCRGFQPISEQEIEIIKEYRNNALKDNNLRMRNEKELGDCYKDFQINRTNWIRTIRVDNEDKKFDYSVVETPQFVPECWITRKSALQRFKAAAWRIIINSRLKIRLKKLIESGGEYHEVDNSHLSPGGENLIFYRSINGISEDRLPQTQLTFDNNFDMSEYTLLLPLQKHYVYMDLVVPLHMHVLQYERVDTSSLTYMSPTCGLQMKPAPNAEATIEVGEDPVVTIPVFPKNTDYSSFDDKDRTLVAFPTSCSYLDNHSYFPLYYYKNELLENKEPVNMEWAVPKSTFLMCKKRMKPEAKSSLVGKALESYLNTNEIPKLMTKSDMEQLDYRLSADSPVITLDMLYQEFPILVSINDSIDNKPNK